MSEPVVSVVIPVFNGLPYLSDAVASVRAQTLSDVELVLVDGGSTDGSREWIENLEDARVRRDFLPPGTPAARTWTRASELGTGTFVKLLCQDDVIYPRALELQVADLQRFPTAGMATAQRDIVAANGLAIARRRGCSGLTNGLVKGRRALETGCRRGTNIFGEPLAVLFRRESLLEALPWEDDQPFLLDMFMYAKVLRKHDLVVRRQSIGAFRVSSASWSTRLASQQRNQFNSWQRHVEQDIAAQPWYRIAQARTNAEVTALTRRAAYAWLRVRRQMGEPPPGAR